ncbi:tyrosine-protein phosphatase [Virgibacillus doumboii]|uniref:tyrosine-protein phosphatase n=1 Tax=Virgibacillus doumboii TaxID=2697503 RepID=UPI0019681193|nr:CpsB/CapC family capsule biosynthesis tyrosine phosphatase [Virgibacillus doumboii]
MIDIHCHILPGVDDGPTTLTQSIEMAERAVDHGIHTIIATPHHRNGRYNNEKQDVLVEVERLNEELSKKNMPLTILPGQEPRIYGELVTDIENGRISPLNGFTKYVFIELPANEIPLYTRQLLFNTQLAGYIPIIVHPERNKKLLENTSILYDFVRNGALTQITASSLIGHHGKHLQKFSNKLINANLAHFIASDAHNTKTRGFNLDEAYQALLSEHGYECYHQFVENCQLLINGKTINKNQPSYMKKKKILGLFG